MNNSKKEFLVLSYMNIRGQSGLPLDKQMQIETFLKENSCDILNLQEVQIEEDTFSDCSFIATNYDIIQNNAENKYGTASIVKNDLQVENVMCDTAGRVLVFDIAGVTFGNLYMPSGTDGTSRGSRENHFGEIIPQILVNRKNIGCIGGDFNCIINKQDASRNPEAKMSPSLSRLAKVFKWVDSFRYLYPRSQTFSRYYQARGNSGASRIDRQYHWGDIFISSADYLPVAFSDHLALKVKIEIPDPIQRYCSPRNRPSFKMREEVVRDSEFQERVKEAMLEWQGIRDEGLPVIPWWEIIVKPGIQKIAINRSKEINQDRRSRLNLLLLRQAYLVRKVQGNQSEMWSAWLTELVGVQHQIQAWYKEVAEKVQHQSRVNEFLRAEQTRIYHHEIHQKHLKKKSILKLQTSDGVIEGHAACAQYLENQVAQLLLNPAELDRSAQDTLLNELDSKVTEEENDMLRKPPDKAEVLETLKAANAQAAPGTDGITSLFYKVCWDTIGDALTDVVKAKFFGEKLPVSMRTAMMVFGTKPKKAQSILPKDKRRISLLNCDFKITEGLEARRFKKIGGRILSPNQYVAGTDRNIHHGIAKARDAIQATMRSKKGCGIADTDFVAAFDWLVLSWVWKVLLRLGVDPQVVRRVQGLYQDSITIVVVNNSHGRILHDKRSSLRQGGCASMDWFCFGIDPLIRYLEKRLQGILIYSTPLQGPLLQGEKMPMAPLEERFIVMAYCDDIKPSVSSMSEFITVDKACSLFELSSGCKLHRDPASMKCKFLALGRWRGVLEQEDIPMNYMVLSDTLDMVGVQLKATWSQSRKVNGDMIQKKVSQIINSWKSGKFMNLTSRPWSLNTYALTKVWNKCHTVDLRVCDINSITSKVKSWLFQDQLEKPAEMVLHRPIQLGGLGLHNVKYKAQASLIRSFMETAGHPSFRHSVYHSTLYRVYVLNDESVENPPPIPPYYSESFFQTIKQVKNSTPLNVATMTTAQWYRLLVEKYITMEEDRDNRMQFINTRTELAFPMIDWESTWRRARLKGLGSEASSFLWKLLHQLLPTEARLSRILPNTSANCKYCVEPIPATLEHCLLLCVKTREVGDWLLGLLREHDNLATPESILKLQFQANTSFEMPLVWIIANTLLYLWGARSNGRLASLISTRANLESKIALLRETRFRNEHHLLEEMLANN